MLCPLCTILQKPTSQVRVTTTVTADDVTKAAGADYDEYWDNNDDWHVHDSTLRVRSYVCSHGHTFADAAVKLACPVVGCVVVF